MWYEVKKAGVRRYVYVRWRDGKIKRSRYLGVWPSVLPPLPQGKQGKKRKP